MTESRQIKIGALISYIAIALNIVIGMFYTPWMIRKIGESQYAIYTLANSLITFFLVDFGLSSATARYVSNYKAQGRQEDINNFLGVIYKLYIAIDMVIFIILFIYFFLIDSTYVSLTAEELRQFKVVYIMSAAFSLFNMPFVTQSGILTAYSKFIQLKFSDLIYRVLLVGLTILALSLGYGIYALVLMHIVAGVLCILSKGIIIKTCTPVHINFKYRDRFLFKSIFKFSFWTTVVALASRLIFSITPTILGIVANSTEIAIFGVVSTMESFFYTITTAINGMFMPTVSKAYTSDEKSASSSLMELFVNVGKYNFIVNGLLCVGFFLLGREFIALWMGETYIKAYTGILLVIIPGLFYNSLEVANTAMTVNNKVHIQAIVSVVYGVVNVVLSFIFSRIYGAIGACLSISIAYFLRAIIYHIIYCRVMKFDIIEFIKKCYLRSIPCFAITIGFWMILRRFFVVTGWGSFFIATALVTMIFFITSICFFLTKAEKRAVLSRVYTHFERGIRS